MRTELFQEPIQSEMKKLLTEYVDLSIELQKDPSKLDYAISRSHQILDMLWEQTKARLVKINQNPIITLQDQMHENKVE
jgi:hypothetical protein